jgi:hypothetical protein
MWTGKVTPHLIRDRASPRPNQEAGTNIPHASCNDRRPTSRCSRRPRLVVTITATFSPVVEYHGLDRRHLTPLGLLMRPQLNGGTLIWNDGSSSKGGFSSRF